MLIVVLVLLSSRMAHADAFASISVAILAQGDDADVVFVGSSQKSRLVFGCAKAPLCTTLRVRCADLLTAENDDK